MKSRCTRTRAMNVRPLLFIAAVTLVHAAPGVAEEPGLLTLREAVSLALVNNPELRVLEARLETARRNIGVARARSFNPELAYDEGLERHIGVSQTIEWPGKRALREAMAKQDTVAARAALDGFKVALAAEVRAVFYEVLASQKLVEVQQVRLKAAERFSETASGRVSGGFAPVTERAKAAADLVRARRGLRAEQKSLAVARLTLNLLLGRPADTALELQGDLAAPDARLLEVPLAKILSAALERSPELRIQRAELEKKDVAIRLAGKEAAPDITIGPFYEQDARDSGQNKVGVSVALPLPVWRTRGPFVAAAVAEQVEARTLYESTSRSVAAEIAKAYAALTSAREELALYPPDLLGELEAQLKVTQERYANGQVSFLVLVDAQETYFDYLASYYEAISNDQAALSELEKAAAVSLEDLE